MAIAPALSDAAAGQNVEVRAGTYEEDLAFDKQLNINGPNAGIAHDGTRGAEAIIDGEHTLSATGAVMLDGLQFLSNNPPRRAPSSSQQQQVTPFRTTNSSPALQEVEPEDKMTWPSTLLCSLPAP